MVRLTEDDSVPKVEDAAERHMRLCTQNRNADKYSKTIQPLFSDMVAKKETLKKTKKEVNSANDTVGLYDTILDDVLRDVQGRAKEYDRNNPGSNVTNIIFPGGNISSIITLPDKEEPDVAHGVALKIISLGANHALYPFAEQIETAVGSCKTALGQQVAASQAAGDASTALVISKIALIRQYNANYFVAAADVDKNFAERLFPQLHNTKKKKDDTETSDQ